MSDEDKIGYQRDSALAINEIKELLGQTISDTETVEEVKDILSDYGLW